MGPKQNKNKKGDKGDDTKADAEGGRSQGALKELAVGRRGGSYQKLCFVKDGHFAGQIQPDYNWVLSITGRPMNG